MTITVTTIYINNWFQLHSVYMYVHVCSKRVYTCVHVWYLYQVYIHVHIITGVPVQCIHMYFTFHATSITTLPGVHVPSKTMYTCMNKLQRCTHEQTILDSKH